MDINEIFDVEESQEQNKPSLEEIKKKVDKWGLDILILFYLSKHCDAQN